MPLPLSFLIPIDKRIPGTEVLRTNDYQIVDTSNYIRSIEVPLSGTIPDYTRLDVWMDNVNPGGTRLTETATQSDILTDPTKFYVEYDVGRISFNSNWQNHAVYVTYYGTGSTVWARDVVNLQNAALSLNTETIQKDGSTAMAADLDMGTHSLIDVNLVDTIKVATHTHTGVAADGSKIIRDSITVEAVGTDQIGKKGGQGAGVQTINLAAAAVTNVELASDPVSLSKVSENLLQTDGANLGIGTVPLNDARVTFDNTFGTLVRKMLFYNAGGVKAGIGLDTSKNMVLFYPSNANISLRAADMNTPDLVTFDALGNVSITNQLTVNTARVIGSGASALSVSNGITTNTLAVNSTSYLLGYVGIGTTSPAVPLHVKSTGSIQIETESNSTDVSGIRLNNTSTNGKSWTITSNGTAHTAPGGLDFHDETAGISRMTIDTNGNVGIGNSNANRLLELGVYANTNSPSLRINGSTWQNTMELSGNAIDVSSADLALNSAGSQNVAIGNTSAFGYKLYVQGSQYITSTLTVVNAAYFNQTVVSYVGTSQYGNLYMFNATSIIGISRSDHLWFSNWTNGYGFKWCVNNNAYPSMFLDSNGLLGIGYNFAPTDPYLLDVNGSVRILGGLYMPNLPSYDVYDDIAELRKLDLNSKVDIKDVLGFVVGGLKQLADKVDALAAKVN